MTKHLSSFVLLLFLYITAHSQEMKIHSNFPGGNILIDSIKGDSIWLKPDSKDNEYPWFYWNFCVENAASKTLHFILNQKEVIPLFGPSCSHDNGLTWNWLYEKDTTYRNQFSYTFSKKEKSVRFSFAKPYVEQNFNHFIKNFSPKNYFKIDTLCTTRKGRKIEKLYFKNPESSPQFTVLIIARQHACEMMESYVLEGIVSELYKSFAKKSNPFSDFEFIIIPLMDKDGVELGEQGKGRLPKDHNRDWGGTSIHESTNTIRNNLNSWSLRKKLIVVDLHCPGLRGFSSKQITIMGNEDSLISDKEKKFAKILAKNCQGELKFEESGYIKFTKNKNNITYEETEKLGKMKFSQFMRQQNNSILQIVLEMPYSHLKQIPLTDKNLKGFGADFLNSILIYSKEFEKK